MSILKKYLKKNKKFKFHDVREFSIGKKKVPFGFVPGQTYPQVSVVADQILIKFCPSITTPEYILGFYRIHNFLKELHLELDELSMNHNTVWRYNPRHERVYFQWSPFYFWEPGWKLVQTEPDEEDSDIMLEAYMEIVTDIKLQTEIFWNYGRIKWLEEQKKLHDYPSGGQTPGTPHSSPYPC